MQMIVTALVAFLGSFTQASSGFGNAIVCMALWPLVMPFHTASALEANVAFFMVISISIRLRKYINFKLLIPPAIGSIMFSFLGVKTLLAFDHRTMQIILGGALLILSGYFAFFSEKVKLKPNWITGICAGALSGFMGGLLSIGGPPMVAYFLAVTDDKNEYNATLQGFFVINTLCISFMHLSMGNTDLSMLPLLIAGIIGTFIGTILGLSVFKKLTMKGIRKIIYLFMLVAGLYNIFLA